MRPLGALRTVSGVGVMAAFAVCVASVVGATPGPLPPLEQIDVSTAGEPAEYQGLAPSLSADGRFVAFSSSGNNLVPNDTNPIETPRDVFVRDRALSMTTRVSVAADGSQGEDGESDTPSVSADGRYVAFVSWASTLVPGDTNGSPDVFVHDRARHRTTRVSVRSDGAPANHGASAYPVISADGRFVAFSNSSTNLVPGYTRPGMRIYLHDRRRGRTTVVRSRRGRSDNYPSISANGRMVAFERSGRRSARILVWDRKARRTLRVDVSTHDRGANAASVTPAISANGRYVAFVSAASNLVPHDRNGGQDVFVRDLRRGRTIQASLRPNGTPLSRCPRDSEAGEGLLLPCGDEPALSATGRFIVFSSPSRRFDTSTPRRGSGVFLRDLRLKKTVRVLNNDGWLHDPAISGDGRFVAFTFTGDGLLLRGPMR